MVTVWVWPWDEEEVKVFWVSSISGEVEEEQPFPNQRSIPPRNPPIPVLMNSFRVIISLLEAKIELSLYCKLRANIWMDVSSVSNLLDSSTERDFFQLHSGADVVPSVGIAVDAGYKDNPLLQSV